MKLLQQQWNQAGVLATAIMLSSSHSLQDTSYSGIMQSKQLFNNAVCLMFGSPANWTHSMYNI